MMKHTRVLVGIGLLVGVLVTAAYGAAGEPYPFELFKSQRYGAQIKSVLPRGMKLKQVREYFAVSDGMHREGRFWYGSGCVPHSCTISEGFMVFEGSGSKPYLIVMDTPNPMNQSRRQFVSYGVRLRIEGNRAQLDRPYPAALRAWFSDLNVTLE